MVFARVAARCAAVLALSLLYLSVTPVAAQTDSSPPIEAAAAEDAAAADAQTAEDNEAEALLALMQAPWTGDLDGIVARGFLRIGVAYGAIFFNTDGPREYGLNVDVAQEFQKHLRKTLGKPAANLTVVLAPLPRDKLIPALVGGHVDLLTANLTITPERLAQVDFGAPGAHNVRELVVTGPSAPLIATLDDLANVELHVRASSSYHEHLKALDARRRAEGKAPLTIVAVEQSLEDEDIVELVHLGVLPATVVDDHKALLFVKIFDKAVAREDLAVNEGGEIAWAMRKGSPKLMAAANGFMKVAHVGTKLGNILTNKYFKDEDRIRSALDPDALSRFEQVIGFIRDNAGKYDFDALLIAAQGYQESGLDQKKRSPVGAVGVMQVMPATAGDPNVAIRDIHIAERNVEAGVKYLRFLRERYFDDPAISPLDKVLFSFAAYNAGPGNIAKSRRRAEKMGLDPNVWFGNVEIATAKAVSREPVVYVRNIMKYYVTYRVAEARKAARSN